MNKLKEGMKKLLVALCMVSLLISLVQPLNVQAFKQAEGVKETSSTTFPDLELELPLSWSVKMEGTTITFDIVCPDAAIESVMGTTWTVQINGSLNEAPYYKPLTYMNFPYNSAKCSISGDMSQLPAGLRTISVNIESEGVRRYAIEIYVNLLEDGTGTIYSPYGQAAIDEMAYYNANYNPEDYKNPATYNALILAQEYAEYDEIIAKAQELTANCTNDMEKIKAIYEWICTNFAYDYEAIRNNDYGLQNNAGWVFVNKRAVCGGFSSLATTMYRAAGIPCIELQGESSSTGILDDGAEDELLGNHSWNIVYYNDSWHYLDITWDCANKYYGEGNAKNTSGKAPNYKYFGMPAVTFGMGHYELIPNTSAVATGIKVTGFKSKYNVGDKFNKLYNMYYVTSDGSQWKAKGFSLGECTGYDMNTPGKQTVTVSYRGFTTTFEIEVLDEKSVTGIKATKTKTTYEVGDTLNTNDIKVTATCADGTTKEVTGFTVDTSKVNMNTAGNKTFTVSYEGKTADVTIKVNPHTVKFGANGGTKLSKNSITVSAHNGKITALPTVERKGYNFKGWYTAKTGGTKVTTATQIGKSMTVYAQWTKVAAPGKGKTPTLKSKKSGQITVSYKKVTGAKGYEIAYSTSKNFAKGTVKTTTLTGTSKTITKLTPGKTYYVKVRAYVLDGAKNKVYGTYSSVKNITLAPKTASTPTLKSKKSGELTLTLKKVANAKGYQITYSTNKKFTKATTKSTSITKTSTTLKKLKKGKTYYVKVRAFVKNASKKNVYGAYSKVKSIKIKK